jgi:Ser/Thr protein kinase RdoA (MazF antagonist)
VTAADEIPLSGGTQNTVVRCGDTVRRRPGPWTPAVHDLLRHVRRAGFDLAPEPLDFDEQGREVLRYIEGDTVGWALPWPDWLRTDQLLDDVGRALARYHNAAAGFAATGARWQSGPPATMSGTPLIAHNDVAPYNIVAAGGRLAGLIDWDLAGPGTARADLAFAAWQWVPLHGPFVTSLMGWDGSDRRERLHLLLETYGAEADVDWGTADHFIDAVVERVGYNRSVMLERAAAGDPAYQALVDQGHIGGMDEALGFLAGEGRSL